MNSVTDHERKLAKARAAGLSHIVDAHVHCAHHRQELEASKVAGCFYCCETFPPAEIADWIDNNDCALCPRCGIDSVIGDASGFPAFDRQFLQQMNGFWF